MMRRPLPALSRSGALVASTACAALTWWSVANGEALGGEGSRPRILIVNDDGIESAGVQALVDAFAPIAEVHVCAPDFNRSGSSASTTALSEFMSIEERTLLGATSAWAVGGQPVDAAQFGLFELGPTGDPQDFDLVISGINRGTNVGDTQQYSGTVGAASAAVHYGVPAIAISQDRTLPNFLLSAQAARRFATELFAQGGHEGIVYSINVPVAQPGQIAAVSPAPQGGADFLVSGFRIQTDAQGNQTAKAETQSVSSQPSGSDTELYQLNHITITPLRVDRTDPGAVADLQTWNF